MWTTISQLGSAGRRSTKDRVPLRPEASRHGLTDAQMRSSQGISRPCSAVDGGVRTGPLLLSWILSQASRPCALVAIGRRAQARTLCGDGGSEQSKGVDVARPVPTRLYNFTSIDHLETIVQHGLLADTTAAATGLITVVVGNRGIKERRRSAVAASCRSGPAAWWPTTPPSTTATAVRVTGGGGRGVGSDRRGPRVGGVGASSTS